MDPLKSGGPLPLTEEWFHQQKKLLKQAGVEKTSAAHAAHDVYTPSLEASRLPATPQEKFLEEARAGILEMDVRSESFVADATSLLVDSALGQEFGEALQGNPGYAQMQSKITRTILQDPRYRELMEDFLGLLVGAPEGEHEAADEPGPGSEASEGQGPGAWPEPG